jgi:hypothetical protein
MTASEEIMNCSEVEGETEVLAEHGQRKPTPPAEDEEDRASGEETEQPLPKRKNTDDDYEYRPEKRRKTAVQAAPRRGVKYKQPASTQSPGTASLQKSKARTTGAASLTAKILLDASGSTKGGLACPECYRGHFKDDGALEDHKPKKHTRPFKCVFHFAGCESTFASKNEWKRHVNTQHLVLQFWLYQEGGCAKTVNGPARSSGNAPGSKSRGQVIAFASSSGSAGPQLPNGVIFNRKDLYTQHLRHMRIPHNVKKVPKQQQQRKSSAGAPAAAAIYSTNQGHPTPRDREERHPRLQDNAAQIRCELPEYMRCPAPGCSSEFTGWESWDQRMEHVACHLEMAAQGKEANVVFGGIADPSLMQWAASADVAVVRSAGPGRWKLNNPLKLETTVAPAGRGGKTTGDVGDADNDNDDDGHGGDGDNNIDDYEDDVEEDDYGDDEVKNEIVISQQDEHKRRN